MAFKKGDKKPASSGIKKGSEHKTTAQAKELIITAINNQSEEFNQTMALIRLENPTEWAKIMVRLMDFVLPKKVDITTLGEKIEPNVINLGTGIEPKE